MKTLSMLSLSLGLFATASFAGQPATSTPVAAITPEVSNWEIAPGVSFGELNLQWTFDSTLGFDSSPLRSSTSDSYVSPALDIRRVLSRSNGFTLRLGAGYSYAEGKWKTGEHIAGEVGEGTDELYTLDIASMEVSAHRLAAYLDAGWDVGGGWELGLRVGPTVTIFDGKFSGSHETFQHINPGEFGVFRTGNQSSIKTTKTSVGVSGEAFVRYTVPSTKVFIEVSGGYNWTDKAQFGSSQIGAKLDAASWRAGVSVGFKF